MGKLDELEHDTHEDAAQGIAPSGLAHRLVLPEPPITTPAQRIAADVRDRRRHMKAQRTGEDSPWLDIENPAIWTGDIGEDD